MDFQLVNLRQNPFPDFVFDWKSEDLAPVVQTMDSAIHRINHYPVDKH